MPGTTYGSRTYRQTDIDQVLGIPLNAAAIMGLNSALGGGFALGGAIASIDSSGSEFVFGGRGNVTRQLVLTFVIEIDVDIKPGSDTNPLLSHYPTAETGIAFGGA